MYNVLIVLRGEGFKVVIKFRGAVRRAEEVGDFGRVVGGVAVLL